MISRAAHTHTCRNQRPSKAALSPLTALPFAWQNEQRKERKKKSLSNSDWTWSANRRSACASDTIHNGTRRPHTMHFAAFYRSSLLCSLSISFSFTFPNLTHICLLFLSIFIHLILVLYVVLRFFDQTDSGISFRASGRAPCMCACATPKCLQCASLEWFLWLWLPSIPTHTHTHITFAVAANEHSIRTRN